MHVQNFDFASKFRKTEIFGRKLCIFVEENFATSQDFIGSPPLLPQASTLLPTSMM